MLLIVREKYIYAIACFLFSIFVGREVVASVRFMHAEVKSIFDNCESRSTEECMEESGFEQEQKLLTEILFLQKPEALVQLERAIYKTLHVPTIYIGIITPPPKAQ